MKNRPIKFSLENRFVHLRLPSLRRSGEKPMVRPEQRVVRFLIIISVTVAFCGTFFASTESVDFTFLRLGLFLFFGGGVSIMLWSFLTGLFRRHRFEVVPFLFFIFFLGLLIAYIRILTRFA